MAKRPRPKRTQQDKYIEKIWTRVEQIHDALISRAAQHLSLYDLAPVAEKLDEIHAHLHGVFAKIAANYDMSIDFKPTISRRRQKKTINGQKESAP